MVRRVVSDYAVFETSAAPVSGSQAVPRRARARSHECAGQQGPLAAGFTSVQDLARVLTGRHRRQGLRQQFPAPGWLPASRRVGSVLKGRRARGPPTMRDGPDTDP